LRKYLKFTEDNEAPETYHVWSGLAILGHALGKHIWLDRGYFTNYPGQIMVVLVGPSGLKKSTATSIAANILGELPNVNVIANKLSAQSLIDSLDLGFTTAIDGRIIPADSYGFIHAPEFSSFIPKQQYVEELIPLLTEFSDASHKVWKYKTRHHGTIELQSPMVSMLGASTPEWLISNIPTTAYDGGFMSRILWVWQEHSSRLNPRPEKNIKLTRMRKEIVAELIWIHNNIRGPVQWSKEADEWWEPFYKSHHTSPKASQGGILGGFHARLPEHILRIGMCLAVAESHSLTLKPAHLEAADVLLQSVENGLPNAFAQRGSSASSGNSQRILDILRVDGQMTRSELLKRLWRYMNATEFASAVETLIQSDLIELVQVGRTLAYHLASEKPHRK
jgi:hypothetical protein